MKVSRFGRSERRASMPSRRVAMLGLAIMGLINGHATVGIEAAAAQDNQKSSSLKGMGAVSGTVAASKPFKAAQV